MTVWPQVVDALLSLLPGLPGWDQVKVYDGLPLTGDTPRTFVTVGYSTGEDMSGNAEDTNGLGDIGQESGVVRSDLVCWSGSGTVTPLRAQAFGLYDAWRDAVRADPSLGLPAVNATLAVDAEPEQTASGPLFRLTVTLSYTAVG